jgi:hypothetical protein
MPATPDRFPGVRYESEIEFEPIDSDPSENRVVLKNGVGYVFNQQGTLKKILDPDEHKTIRQLIHLIDSSLGGGPTEGFSSNAFQEITPNNTPFWTDKTWYESSSKLKKITKTTVTWSGPFPVTITAIVYKTDGVNPQSQIQDSITWNGPFESNRTRSIVVY